MAFFKIADSLGLKLKDVERELALRLPTPPSYRTLQDWRSGRRAPKFAPLLEWGEILKLTVKPTDYSRKVPAKPRSPEQVSETMALIKSTGSSMEAAFEAKLRESGINFEKQPTGLEGKPDFIIPHTRVALFCDSDFWHGRGFGKGWVARFGTKAEYWMDKIGKNVARDVAVTRKLRRAGWAVIRFWESDLKLNSDQALREIKRVEKRRATLV